MSHKYQSEMRSPQMPCLPFPLIRFINMGTINSTIPQCVGPEYPLWSQGGSDNMWWDCKPLAHIHQHFPVPGLLHWPVPLCPSSPSRANLVLWTLLNVLFSYFSWMISCWGMNTCDEFGLILWDLAYQWILDILSSQQLFSCSNSLHTVKCKCIQRHNQNSCKILTGIFHLYGSHFVTWAQSLLV